MWAVVNVFVGTVVEKIARLAKVAGHFGAAAGIATRLSDRLHIEAVHAHHLADLMTVDLMVGLGVVAKPATEELVAARGQDLASAGVVLTSKNSLFLTVESGEPRVHDFGFDILWGRSQRPGH
mmetsp:Transcript_66914/g.100900  ORF Transcript_66914/g.100900 Transcript_66914/m.100900 type:complete len:123 (+) Transcript_66914:561-929(+)